MSSNTEQSKTGMQLILEERQRQIEKEGWTSYHDATHDEGELAAAAMCYYIPAEQRQCRVIRGALIPEGWPWEIESWKPTPNDRIRELVKAGALYVAENDRLKFKKYGPKVLNISYSIDRLIKVKEFDTPLPAHTAAGLSAEEILDKKFYMPETRDWYKPVITAMHEYASQSQSVEKIVMPDEFMGAWPLKDVLSKLVEATDILLHKKDYDGHGWELMNHAIDKANEIIEYLDKRLAVQSQSVGTALETCTYCNGTNQMYVATPTVGGGYTMQCPMCQSVGSAVNAIKNKLEEIQPVIDKAEKEHDESLAETWHNFKQGLTFSLNAIQQSVGSKGVGQLLTYWQNEYERNDYKKDFPNEHLSEHGKMIVRSNIAAFIRDLKSQSTPVESKGVGMQWVNVDKKKPNTSKPIPMKSNGLFFIGYWDCISKRIYDIEKNGRPLQINFKEIPLNEIYWLDESQPTPATSTSTPLKGDGLKIIRCDNKVVLENSKGDTYTSKDEDLIDFLQSHKSSPSSPKQ